MIAFLKKCIKFPGNLVLCIFEIILWKVISFIKFQDYILLMVIWSKYLNINFHYSQKDYRILNIFLQRHFMKLFLVLNFFGYFVLSKIMNHRYSHLVLPNRVVICGFLISISQIRQISVLIGEKSA